MTYINNQGIALNPNMQILQLQFKNEPNPHQNSASPQNPETELTKLNN